MKFELHSDASNYRYFVEIILSMLGYARYGHRIGGINIDQVFYFKSSKRIKLGMFYDDDMDNSTVEVHVDLG